MEGRQRETRDFHSFIRPWLSQGPLFLRTDWTRGKRLTQAGSVHLPQVWCLKVVGQLSLQQSEQTGFAVSTPSSEFQLCSSLCPWMTSPPEGTATSARGVVRLPGAGPEDRVAGLLPPVASCPDHRLPKTLSRPAALELPS